jgi:type II restriction/modification system DNA methylase subunit YeeA
MISKNALKKFATSARNSLRSSISKRLDQLCVDDPNKIPETYDVRSRVLIEDKRFDVGGEFFNQRNRLIKAVNDQGKDNFIEQMSYTWFNRLIALYYMELHGFLEYSYKIFPTPQSVKREPEILTKASQLHLQGLNQNRLNQLLKTDQIDEAYQLILIAICNDMSAKLPFLFEALHDYSELVLPTSLLSNNSIIMSMVNEVPVDSWSEVEVIGWLYQFYISEKKDEVFSDLKKNKKITPENIPAATQLFTPHWIVRYLVENSLGRLWMLNHPNTKLIDQMDYYIKPAEIEKDYIKIKSPEEIKICDPACGSGHMLVYAFDLLYSIYEESGYSSSEIPEKILSKNLYGIEIDARAGQLSSLALTMKARNKQKSFLTKKIEPKICVLENVHFTETELNNYMDVLGRDLFTADFQITLKQFEEADNFGSLIQPNLKDIENIKAIIEAKQIESNLFLIETHNKVLKVLNQTEYLNPNYHIVIANPPYMGTGGFNDSLKRLATTYFSESKSDLFSMFIERCLSLSRERGLVAMITMHSWMFLSSFEKLRAKLLDNNTILTMAHLGPRAFDSIGGEVVQTTAFIIKKDFNLDYRGQYIRLVNLNSESEKSKSLLIATKVKECEWFYISSSSSFKKIPGYPIAYWVSNSDLLCFEKNPSISEYANSSNGIQTGKNEVYVRRWTEISYPNIGLKWFPYNKGGIFRKWFGNYEYLVNWENNGKSIKLENNACIRGEEFYFKKGITWSDVTSGKLSCRLLPEGFLFDASGPSAFFKMTEYTYIGIGLLNSKFADYWSKILNPTLHFQSGDFRKLTLPKSYISDSSIHLISNLIDIAKEDWNSYETSWDFDNTLFLNSNFKQRTLKETYLKIRKHWNDKTQEMKGLEEDNNAIVSEAYDLHKESTQEITINEITLTSNPYYRYGNNKSEKKLEELLLSDTVKEFISYSVGCMIGRYSLDKKGLVYAGGEFDSTQYATFPADDDGVIPLNSYGIFTDDIQSRFRQFVRSTFGKEHFEENMKFVANALQPNHSGFWDEVIAKFIENDLYKDHVKRYKKRPIYWLFSSGKHKAFSALMYLHRYNPQTVSIVRTRYVHKLLNALRSELTLLEKMGSTRANDIRRMTEIRNKLTELKSYDEKLQSIAEKRIALDLDDGVLVNHKKLEDILAPI